METPDNKKDNPIFLEKGLGIGWTFNFNNKWSYVILAGIIIFSVVCIVYATMQGK